MSKPATSIWTVDAIKAVASQLIVWHHFALYGPMAKAIHPHASHLMDWLASDARLVVQAFLVIGGFLAARALAPRPHMPTFDGSPGKVMDLIRMRYLRLVRPFAVALLLAIVFAAIARRLVMDGDTPAPPTFMQILVHGLLLHDIIQVDALSAGVWYVAIDFQLYSLFLLILWAARTLARGRTMDMRAVALGLVIGMSALSLLWFNRDPSMDEWAFYFFGAYSLGIMVQWSGGFTAKHPWLAMLLGILVVSLTIEWRSRLVVAAVTALLVGIGLHVQPLFHRGIQALFSGLSRISYSVFLIHYPVVLIVGSVFAYFWPNEVLPNALGLITAWLLTLVGGHWLYWYVEQSRRVRSVDE
jgi:peptidoglycan/LPS O-acetylase OafA/YrhL